MVESFTLDVTPALHQIRIAEDAHLRLLSNIQRTAKRLDVETADVVRTIGRKTAEINRKALRDAEQDYKRLIAATKRAARTASQEIADLRRKASVGLMSPANAEREVKKIELVHVRHARRIQSLGTSTNRELARATAESLRTVARAAEGSVTQQRQTAARTVRVVKDQQRQAVAEIKRLRRNVGAGVLSARDARAEVAKIEARYQRFFSRVSSLSTSNSRLVRRTLAESLRRVRLEASRAEGPVSRLDRRFSSMSVSVQRLRQLAGGLLVGGGLASAGRVGIDLESQGDDLAAIVGTSERELERLKTVAREAALETGRSATEQVESMKLLASQLELTNRDLGRVGEEVVTLAVGSRIDLATAADAVAGTMNQFDLQAEESTRVVNVLAAGSREGAAEVDDLAESMKNAGATVAGAGLSLETGVAALEVLAANTIKGAEGGTKLRGVLLALQTRGKELAALGLKPVNLEGDGLATTLENLQPLLGDASAMAKIFGRENFNAAQILIRSAGAVRAMEAAVTDTSAAEEMAATQTDNLRGDLQRLRTTVEELAFNGYDGLSGSLRTSVQEATIFTRALDENWESVTTGVKVVALAVLGLKTFNATSALAVTNTGAMTVAETARAQAHNIATAATARATVAFRGFSAAIASNPLGLLVTVLATAGVAMLAFRDDAREATREIREQRREIEELIAGLRQLSGERAYAGQQDLEDRALSLRAQVFNLDVELASKRKALTDLQASGISGQAYGMESARLNREIASLVEERAGAQETLNQILGAAMDNMDRNASSIGWRIAEVRAQIERLGDEAAAAQGLFAQLERLEAERASIRGTELPAATPPPATTATSSSGGSGDASSPPNISSLLVSDAERRWQTQALVLEARQLEIEHMEESHYKTLLQIQLAFDRSMVDARRKSALELAQINDTLKEQGDELTTAQKDQLEVRREQIEEDLAARRQLIERERVLALEQAERARKIVVDIAPPIANSGRLRGQGLDEVGDVEAVQAKMHLGLLASLDQIARAEAALNEAFAFEEAADGRQRIQELRDELARLRVEMEATPASIGQATLTALGTVAGAVEDLYRQAGERNVALFRAYQATSAAQAAVSAYTAAAEMLKPSVGGPPPLNYINAGLVVAAGLARMYAILAQSPGGSADGGRGGTRGSARASVSGSRASGGIVLGGEQTIRVNENGPEYVISAEPTRRYRSVLDAINRGEDPAAAAIAHMAAVQRPVRQLATDRAALTGSTTRPALDELVTSLGSSASSPDIAREVAAAVHGALSGLSLRTVTRGSDLITMLDNTERERNHYL
ncbi:MAG: phage tail tape measure protein [Bacteroidota bacterium]